MDTLSRRRSQIALLLSFSIYRLAGLRLYACTIAAATYSLVSTAPAADVTSTWDGSTGNWTEPAHWSSDPQFPNDGNGGLTYDAILPSGAITLDQDIVIERFMFSGGTLTDTTAFSLFLNDLFTWSGGTMSGTGETNTNGGILIDNAQPLLDGRTLNNGVGSSATLSNFAQLLFGGGAVFNNNGTFLAQTNANNDDGFSGAGAFNNSGTFTRNTGKTNFLISSGIAFNNTGTVNLNSGTIVFNGGYIQTAGVLSLNGGNVSASTPLAVQGGQVVGNGTVSGSLDNSGGTISPGFSLGTLTITGNLSFGGNSSYQCELDTSAKRSSGSSALADQIVANGVSIASGSTVSLSDLGSGTLPLGTVFVVIDNTSANAIAGRFTNLDDDAIVAVGGNTLQASYVGGTGNDLTLTVVAAPPTPTPTPGSCLGTFAEDFDSVLAPALPANWVASNAQGAAPLWVTSNTAPDTGSNSAFVDDPGAVADKLLDTPGIAITTALAQMSFRNNYNLESTYDGGVLEVSSPNINGAAFTDITDAAVGGSFVTGGYNGPISTAFSSPIAGRMAWSGSSSGYINTVVNLGPNVAGQTIKLRFRMASDIGIAMTGWWIDAISITDGGCATPTPTPTPTAIPCTGTFTENFDSVIPPALPANWMAFNASGPAPLWVTSNSGVPTPVADSGPNAASIDEPTVLSDKWLHSPSLIIPSATAQLSFRNNYNLESTFDGGVLEISLDSGATFTDILTAGGSFVTGGYNATISTAYGSPIAGRLAWSGNSGGFITTTVNLPASADGQSVVFRWRMGSDVSISAEGWRIDSIQLACNGATPTPKPTTPTPTSTPTPTASPTPTPIVTPTPIATPTPPPTVAISGTVSYCSNPIPGPVANVTLTLTGSASDSTLTDESGTYTFSSLAAGGSYIVTPTQTALTPGSTGIDTFDAIAVQRHYIGATLIPPGCGVIAADVNGDHRIDTSDVVAIQRFYVGRPFGTANVGKYQFTPASRTYPAVSSNQTDQNYDTLVFGDVAAGFVPRPEDPSQDAAGDAGTNVSTLSGLNTGVSALSGLNTSFDEAPAPVATLSLPKVAVDAFVTNFTVQVTTTAIEAKNKLIGFQGDFTFDERMVTFQSEPVQKAGLTGGNWNVLGNVLPGTGPLRTLRISAYSNDFTPLSGSGTLFELRMSKVNNAVQSTQLIWAAPPNHFIFIDADLNPQKPGNTAPGSINPSISPVGRGR